MATAAKVDAKSQKEISIETITKYMQYTRKYDQDCYLVQTINATIFSDIPDNLFDKFIARITVGGSNSHLRRSLYYKAYNEPDNLNSPGQLLEKIVKGKLPNAKQLDKLINCAVLLPIKQYEWVDYIISKGVHLTEKQLKILLANGYQRDLKLLINDNAVLPIDIILTTTKLENNLDLLEDIIVKNKIKLTNEHYKMILESNIVGISKITEKIINLGFVPDSETINLFLDCFAVYSKPDMNFDTLEKLVNKKNPLLDIHLKTSLKLNKSSSQLDILLFLFEKLKFNPTTETICTLIESSSCYSFQYNLTIYTYLTKIIEKGIKITDQILEKIYTMLGNLVSYYPAQFESASKILFTILKSGYVPKINLYKLTINNCNAVGYKELLEEFVKYKFYPNNETIIFACTSNNEVLFDFCMKHKILPNMDCLYAVCAIYTTHTKILEKLYNMKLIPDEKSLIIALENKTGCVENLLENGAPLTDYVLDIFLGTYNTNIALLEKYGVAFNDAIYKVCHKYSYYPDKLINSLQIDKFQITLINMCLNHAMDDVIIYKEEHKLEFDKFCYDNLFKAGYDNSYVRKREFCELAIKNGLYKVDIVTIFRISNIYAKYKLYEEYISKN